VINYKQLFPSSDVSGLSSIDAVDLLGQTVLASEKYHYFWLLSHSPSLSFATLKMLSVPNNVIERPADQLLLTSLLAPDNKNFVRMYKEVALNLKDILRADCSVLENEILIRIYKYSLQQLREVNDGSDMQQHSTLLNDWSEKCRHRFEAFMILRSCLRNFSCENGLKRVLLYELAYFLNLLPFETTFKALRIHGQREKYSKIL